MGLGAQPASLFFGFLIPKATDETAPPTHATFTEKCSRQEFEERINQPKL